MSSSPVKYPLITAAIDTNTIAGAKNLSVGATAFTFNNVSDIKSAPKNNIPVNTNPIPPNKANATLKIRFAPFLSPIAILSDTSLAITDGIPILDIVSITAYTSYPVE